MATRPNSADALLGYSVLDCAPGPVFVLDADWDLRYLNQACIAILGRGDADALIGRRLFDIVPELLSTPFQAQVESCVPRPESQDCAAPDRCFVHTRDQPTTPFLT